MFFKAVNESMWGFVGYVALGEIAFQILRNTASLHITLPIENFFDIIICLKHEYQWCLWNNILSRDADAKLETTE